MLTRKQQWRRIKKVRRQHPRSIIDLDLLATSKKKRHLEGKPPQQQPQHAPCFGEDVEGEEDTGSSSSSSSSSSSGGSFSGAWSCFDSLHDGGSISNSDDDDDDGGGCGAPLTASLPLDPTATSPNNLVDPSSSAAGTPVAFGEEVGAARSKGVSFQQEVQVFLVTHKNELDHSAKRALWWTGRDAAINKRAWLNHLGQPGCGRQSVVRPRKEPRHQQEEGRASNFLGAGRNTAAGRGRGIWSAHQVSLESDGYGGGAVMTGVGAGAEEGLDAAQLLLSSSPSPPVSVGILGCRCEACLTEGDENDQQQHQQPRSDWSTPPYSDHQPPPSPSPYQRPVFNYNYNYRPPPSPVPSHSRYGRPASKTWPSPADWARGDGDDGDGMGCSLGGRSRSYSPASSRQGTSPLREACESYDDDDDVFPRGSNFFDDDDDG